MKEETSALTVSVESLFFSCVIDAKEHRKVVTCDIPGAFMQADINEVLHVRGLEGPLAKFLTKRDPDCLYTKLFVSKKENGKDVMYVQLTKALYGTLQTALLLFWKDLTSGYLLVEQGFVLNPYMTIAWRTRQSTAPSALSYGM